MSSTPAIAPTNSDSEPQPDSAHGPVRNDIPTPRPVPAPIDGIPLLPTLTAAGLVAGLQVPKSRLEEQNGTINGGSENNGEVSEFDFYRLGLIGEDALKFAVTSYLLEEKPWKDSESVRVRRRRLLHSSVLSYWALLYRLTDRSPQPNELSDELKADLLKAYAGAIYHQDGMHTIQSWIGDLVRYTEERSEGATKSRLELVLPSRPAAPSDSSPSSRSQGSSSSAKPPSHASSSNPKRKRSRSPDPAEQRKKAHLSPEQGYIPLPAEPESTLVPRGPGNSAVLVHPIPSKPPAAVLGQNGVTLAPGSTDVIGQASTSVISLIPQTPPILVLSGVKFLSHLNQVSVQKRVKLIWQFSSSGPPHMMEWFANLLVDGKVVSGGKGLTKQAAKEDAAKKACYELGWASTSNDKPR